MPSRKRILMNSSVTVEEEFKRFLLAKKAKGLAEKTLDTYQQHLSAIGKHLELKQSIEELNTNDLEQMIAQMRDAGLSSTTIRSYTATLKSFFSWCKEKEITDLDISLYVQAYFREEISRGLWRQCFHSSTSAWALHP